jgi:hypothetical protein
MPLAILPGATDLALLVSITPLLVLLPTAAALSLAMDIAAGSFKKHLKGAATCPPYGRASYRPTIDDIRSRFADFQRFDIYPSLNRKGKGM